MSEGIEVEVVGGPHDGEIWAMPEGTKHWLVPLVEDSLTRTAQTLPMELKPVKTMLVPIVWREKVAMVPGMEGAFVSKCGWVALWNEGEERE
jgi:hypothetical protein